jgi:Family of unknown function (DUF6982)
MSTNVVAHFIDHDIVKGTSLDLDPGRPTCHITTEDRGSVEVDLSLCKALYVVKELGGNPHYTELQRPSQGDIRLRGSRKVEISFHDGETLGGLANSFPPKRPFFFVLPMDPKSNNIRILINREAVASMKELDGPATAPSAQPTSPAPKKQRASWVFDGKGIKEIRSD